MIWRKAMSEFREALRLGNDSPQYSWHRRREFYGSQLETRRAISETPRSTSAIVQITATRHPPDSCVLALESQDGMNEAISEWRDMIDIATRKREGLRRSC